MNFLAHFEVDRRAGLALAGDPWFVAGVMVPDLWSRAAGRLDLRRVADAAPRNEEAARLRLGLLRHEEADAAFHTGRAFRERRRELVPAARALIPRASVAGFLAHLAVELVLDRLLLLNDPALAAAFYGALEPLAPEGLEAELIGLAGPAAAGFGARFAQFSAGRHLADYTRMERVAASASRVLSHLLAAPPSPAELVPFLEVTQEALRAGSPAPHEIERWLSLEG